MKYIIYGLYCPKTNKPVYVGKSSSGIDRPFMHINEKSHSDKVNEWIANLKEDGLLPVLVVLEHSDIDSEMVDKEKYWITKLLSEGNILLNLASVTPAFFRTIQYDIEDVDVMDSIAKYCKARRKLLKLSQHDLSQKSGLGIRFIRDVEQGTKKNFSMHHVQKLLFILGGKLIIK